MTGLLKSIHTIFVQRNYPLFSILCCCDLYFFSTECSQIFYLCRPRPTPTSSLVVFRRGKSAKGDARFLHSFTEVMMSNRLTYYPFEMPLPSPPKPRIKHGIRHPHLILTLIWFSIYCILSWFCFFFFLLPTVPLLMRRHWSKSTTCYLFFLPISQTLCVTESGATCLSSIGSRTPRNLIPLCSPALNFLRLQPISHLPPLLVQTKLNAPLLWDGSLPSIFNLSRYLHSFHSIWKSSFIIPIHSFF